MPEVSVNDIITACLILRDVIEKREKEERKAIDKTISRPLAPTPLTDGQRFSVGYRGMKLHEAQELYDRLFAKIPRDRL